MKGNLEKYIHYFDRSVLNHYKTNSHAYKVIEDDMGGEIGVSENWTDLREEAYPYIELKFGFRKLSDDRICVAIFMPGFTEKVSKQDYAKWSGFELTNPTFSDNDQAFNRWKGRYIEGSWEVEDGPRREIENSIKKINALTKQAIGSLLFKVSNNQLVNYPAAENTAEYTKSILELYRLIIDGIIKDTIELLAKHLSVNLSDPTKTLNSLKEVLAPEWIDKIHEPLKSLSIKRMLIHGIPSSGSQTINAHEKYHQDLLSVKKALLFLIQWLEYKFKLSASSCLKREESMSNFPIISTGPCPPEKMEEAQKMVGKTIKSVDFGGVEYCQESHGSEALALHFEDGSSLSIQIGSNAYNISMKHRDIKPSDFGTDIMLFWADSISIKE